jgi:hypothetical protein
LGKFIATSLVMILLTSFFTFPGMICEVEIMMIYLLYRYGSELAEQRRSFVDRDTLIMKVHRIAVTLVRLSEDYSICLLPKM